MGFFSRLFHLAAMARLCLTIGVLPPSSQASELVLPTHEDAWQVMAEFDIDAAIASHESWLPVAGPGPTRRKRRTPAPRSGARRCVFRSWASGCVALARGAGHLPAYDMPPRRHRYFYQQAALMLLHAEAWVALAEQTLRFASMLRAMVLLLKRVAAWSARGRSTAPERTKQSPSRVTRSTSSRLVVPLSTRRWASSRISTMPPQVPGRNLGLAAWLWISGEWLR